jgi:hypothetical protein
VKIHFKQRVQSGCCNKGGVQKKHRIVSYGNYGKRSGLKNKKSAIDKIVSAQKALLNFFP